MAKRERNVLRFNIQRKIVANMTTDSWRHIPHVSYIYDADVTDFVAAYKQFDEETPYHITFNTVMLKALSEGIKAALDSGVSDLASDDGRQAIIDGIKNGTVDGVSGQISYPKNGDPAKSTLIIGFEPDGTEKVEESVPYQE